MSASSRETAPDLYLLNKTRNTTTNPSGDIFAPKKVAALDKLCTSWASQIQAEPSEFPSFTLFVECASGKEPLASDGCDEDEDIDDDEGAAARTDGGGEIGSEGQDAVSPPHDGVEPRPATAPAGDARARRFG